MANSETGSELETQDMGSEILENDTELGSVHIHNNVIATIARLAAVKVPGVFAMSGGIVDDLAGMIRKKPADKGIRVEFEDTGVVIHLNVILEYGVRIPNVAWQLQTEVREAVEQMTGKHVASVQVIVQGVQLPDSQRPDSEEQDAV